MKFELQYKWQNEPAEVRLDSHRATWAHLSIGTDKRFFTENEPLDNNDKSVSSRNFVSVSVFPLAEFIAANWWPLLHESLEKRKSITDTRSFDSRHWIHKHTDGFAYPEVGIFGAGSAIQFQARSSKITRANIEFTGSSKDMNMGLEGFERGQVEHTLMTFLKATADRLPGNSDSHWIKDLISRISQSREDAEESTYCRFAGLLGSDPYESDDLTFNAISETVSRLGEELAAEMFATAETETVVSRAKWVQDSATAAIKRSRATAQHLHNLKSKLAFDGLEHQFPWTRGYEIARQVRGLMNIKLDAPLANLRAVAQVLLDASSNMISTMPDMEKTSGMLGIVSDDENGVGLALATSDTMSPSKFQLAATVSDYLCAEDSSLFLSTGAATDRQKCNRAFAAEFLAPIAGIREQWSNVKSFVENCKLISGSYAVSEKIVQYQVQNQASDLVYQYG